MKKFSIFICTLLLLAGCAKNETNIYGLIPDQNGSGNGDSPDNSALVTFSASLENRNMTRAMSAMPKGVISEIYSFKASDNKASDPSADGLYITSSAGILSGIGGYKMYLSNGTYNMFGVSNNSTSNPPEINNGKTVPLRNGIDYLWWENLEQDITTSQIHIPIVFQHVSVQIVIDISAGNSLQLDSLVSATILPPSPGGILDLKTGIISPAEAYDTTPFNMGKNKFLTQAIILPIVSNTPMALTLKILADGETTPRTYTANIPIPGKLAGGLSYVFSAIIDGNSVSFPEVSIKDWTEVDETGNPLYPKQ